jgi:hypothetical protein
METLDELVCIKSELIGSKNEGPDYYLHIRDR